MCVVIELPGMYASSNPAKPNVSISFDLLTLCLAPKEDNAISPPREVSLLLFAPVLLPLMLEAIWDIKGRSVERQAHLIPRDCSMLVQTEGLAKVYVGSARLT